MGACATSSKHRIKTTPSATPTPEPAEPDFAVKSTKSKFHANLRDLVTPYRFVRSHKKQVSVARDLPMCSLDVPDALISDLPKSSQDIDCLISALARHPVLSQLTEDAQDLVISSMKHFRMKANSAVFEEGHVATHFFVVAAGRLEVRQGGAVVRTLKAGDSFGELALLYMTNRTATVVTLEKTELWGLDRNSFQEAVHSVNLRNYRENLAFIDTVTIFQVLSHPQKEALLSSWTHNKFQPGDKIVVEGEPGSLFYFIKEGTVSCTVNNLEQRRLGKGDFFGEQALLYHKQRTATITALDTVKTFSLGQAQLQEVLGASLQQIIYRNTLRMAFDKSAALSQLTKEQKENLLEQFSVQRYDNSAVIITAGTDLSSGVWVVLKGTLLMGGKKYAETMDCLGDSLHSSELTVKQDITAEEECDVAFLSQSSLGSSLGGSLASVLASNQGLAMLKRVQLFNGFSKQRLLQLFDLLRIRDFESGETIVKQGEAGSSLFLIKAGQVQILRDGEVIRKIGKHDYFGERAILFKEARTASVVADGSVSCWELLKADFDRVSDSSVRAHLTSRISLQDISVAIPSLKPLRLLGKGTFGHVLLVVDPVSKMLFALKSVSRTKVRKFALQESLSQERELLMRLDHCLIVKLLKTGKDDKRVYFLTEYVPGSDLFDVIRSIGLLRESDARFYSGCLTLILEHLHERGIVYRDLKPENVIINESVGDKQGYPKLIDFGTAKIINENRTFTIVGTPHYTAPEVITGRGYTLAVDFWSLGVLLFEFICGTLPFADGEDDPYAVYESVLQSPLQFPKVGMGVAAQEVIETLLNKNSSMRALGGVEKIKGSSWFHNFDWVRTTQEKLNLGLVRAPFLPKVENLSKEVKAAIRGEKTVQEFVDEVEREEGVKDIGGSDLPGWDAKF